MRYGFEYREDFTFFKSQSVRDITRAYSNELNSLKRANRLRVRTLSDNSLIDFASNDYLALSEKSELLDETYERMKKLNSHAPKSSMLVNGYNEIHKNFEDRLCALNGFEDAVIVGSGFLANISLIESLVRRGDTLFIDEDFHASGNLASHLVQGDVKIFRHNDAQNLSEFLSEKKEGRAIIAVEGVYSMGGDLCEREIFSVADEFEAILIVDEAHSAGILGENLLGIFEHFNIEVKANHIKMGTLGKAYGSYGAYILASKHIIEYLTNRSKPIIYSTAPSIFDTLLAHLSLDWIQINSLQLRKEIKKRQELVKEILNIQMDSLILPINVDTISKLMQKKDDLNKEGFMVGAIRPPTVQKPMLRIIARIGDNVSDFERLLNVL